MTPSNFQEVKLNFGPAILYRRHQTTASNLNVSVLELTRGGKKTNKKFFSFFWGFSQRPILLGEVIHLVGGKLSNIYPSDTKARNKDEHWQSNVCFPPFGKGQASNSFLLIWRFGVQIGFGLIAIHFLSFVSSFLLLVGNSMCVANSPELSRCKPWYHPRQDMPMLFLKH